MSEVRVNERTTPFWCVYFVRSQESGLIKVGRTRNLGQRIAALTSIMGEHPLTLLCVIPTFDETLENHFLKLLKPYCVDGNEWFRVRERDLFAIISEVLRGFRHWSKEPILRIRDHVTG